LFNNIFTPSFIFQFITVVVSLVIHEFAHAWTADRLGDHTARLAGRVTLNPLAHLEPLGLIMILFAPIGWAKPTPVNGMNFKRPRLSLILVTLAGPFSNLLLAILCFALNIWVFPGGGQSLVSVSGFFSELVGWGFIVNVALFVFNLIPIPPLDGSRVLGYLLPYKLAVSYRRLDLYGPFILLLLVMLPGFRNEVFSPLMNSVSQLIISMFGYYYPVSPF
jgi:Zn-dependent protease